MRGLLFSIGTLVGIAGSAFAQPVESFDSISVSCAEASADARTELPEGLRDWAMLRCTRLGYVISAAKGWVWHNPRTNRFMRIWSQPSAEELSEAGHQNYFKSLEFRQLSSQEAQVANVALAAELGARPRPVVDAYALVAIDAQGRTQTINFVRAEANIRLGTFWGVLCSSPCKNPKVFVGFKPT